MLALIVATSPLAILTLYHAYRSAHHDPRALSWVKFWLACLPLVALAAVVGAFTLLDARTLGEGVPAHIMLAYVWLMVAGGAALCIGSIVGRLIGMYRSFGHIL
jgi:hypothetical protein